MTSTRPSSLVVEIAGLVSALSAWLARSVGAKPGEGSTGTALYEFE